MCEGIVSWVTRNQYPIQFEIASFYLYTLLLPILAYGALRYFGYSSKSKECNGESATSLSHHRFSPLFAALISCAIYVLYFYPKLNRSVDLFHEGEFLIPGLQLKFDLEPFKDVYLQHGIGRNYLSFLFAEWFFEPSLLGLRYVQRLLEPLAYVSVFLLGTSLFQRRILSSFLLVIAISGFDYWVGVRQGIGLLALALILSSLRYQQIGKVRGSQLLAGSAAVVSVLSGVYSLEIGIYVSAAIVLSLVLMSMLTVQREPFLAQVVKPYLLVLVFSTLLTLGILSAYGLLLPALGNIQQQIACQAELWGLAYPKLSELVAVSLQIGSIDDLIIFSQRSELRMWLHLPVLLVAGVSILLTALRGETETLKWRSNLLIYVAAIAFFRTALGRSDYGHWIDGSILIWVLLAYLLEDSIRRFCGTIRERGSVFSNSGVVNLIKLSILFSVLSLFLFSFHPLERLKDRVTLVSSGSTLQSFDALAKNDLKTFIPKDQLRSLQIVSAFIQGNTSETEPIFDFSNQSGIHYFSERPIASRLFQATYAVTPEQQREVIAALEKNAVKLVIWKSGTSFDAMDGIPNEERQAILAAYIREHYTVEVSLGSISLRLIQEKG